MKTAGIIKHNRVIGSLKIIAVIAIGHGSVWQPRVTKVPCVYLWLYHEMGRAHGFNQLIVHPADVCNDNVHVAWTFTFLL